MEPCLAPPSMWYHLGDNFQDENNSIYFGGEFERHTTGMREKIPIPAVLGAQMQLILNHKLQTPLRSKILARLQKLTLDQKPDN